jgi:hypothetical protein
MVSTAVDFECGNDGFNFTLTADYPFRHIQQSLRSTRPNGTDHSTKTFPDGGVPRSAEFFVGWGVLTLFYCIIALLVYMFVTANERFERTFDIAVVLDIILHVVWILCWFIASVDWAVAFYRIDDVLHNYMDSLESSECGGQNESEIIQVFENDRESVIYVQAQIAVVFGFLMQLLFAVNIWWLIIDTSWYINWKARRGHSRF